jgi:hypothetical protein
VARLQDVHEHDHTGERGPRPEGLRLPQPTETRRVTWVHGRTSGPARPGGLEGCGDARLFLTFVQSRMTVHVAAVLGPDREDLMGTVIPPTSAGPAAAGVASPSGHRRVNQSVVVEFRDAGEHGWHTVGLGADGDLHRQPFSGPCGHGQGSALGGLHSSRRRLPAATRQWSPSR